MDSRGRDAAGGASPRPAHVGAVALALLLLTAWVFAPALRFGFFDVDVGLYVTENPVVQQGLTWQGLRWALVSGHDSNWLPLTWVSHMLDVELYGLDASGHHATSLLLHGVNVVLLLAALLALTGSLWPSAFVAACFAVHPLRVESVVWVAERKDVLSTAFALLALLAYARFARGGGTRWLVGCGAALALGLLAKSMLVTLPAVLLLLDYWPLRRLGGPGGVPLRRLLLEKLPLLALSVVSGLATLLAQRAGGAMSSSVSLGLAERVGNALVAYAVYLRKAVWPTDLSPFYPHPWLEGRTPPGSGEVLACAALLLLLCAAAWHGRRRGYPLVGWLWFVGMLLPVIGLLQVGAHALADRYTYLPLVGLLIVVAWGARDVLERAPAAARTAAAVAAVAVVATLALEARAQVMRWRDSETLFRYALSLDPTNRFMRFSLARGLLDAGRGGEAVGHYRAILEDAERRRPPTSPEEERVDVFTRGRAWNGLGLSLEQAGDPVGAAEAFRTATLLGPGVHVSHLNLGRALEAQGRVDEAIVAYGRAMELEPRDLRVPLALGGAFEARGEPRRAARYYELVLSRDPGNRPAADALRRLGPAAGAPPGG